MHVFPYLDEWRHTKDNYTDEERGVFVCFLQASELTIKRHLGRDRCGRRHRDGSMEEPEGGVEEGMRGERREEIRTRVWPCIAVTSDARTAALSTPVLGTAEA